ncbi:hypothetical protein EV200_1068 [Pedobacter psychrotolerans]|uniref:Lipocalin-like protein n=1 Tax=Pedobacter psychrotolerans TaxID=1843235 RepID=A0A4R2H9E3_9SPHI|nr:hypothetical protein [Pedobacter psychrotolerans]TCO22370.1 hypothetical protein EV200_1068 [Pedobacter psychrotolerans]GGE64069.1 hypothetical protein GCM10011413_33100 [Pedobacter psychrotolerans]
MKKKYFGIVILLSVIACSGKKDKKENSTLNIQGTWELISSEIIENGKSRFTPFSGEQKMIKIINGTHFAFLKYSLNPKDSSSFDAGGGSYTLNQHDYTEHLDYYKDKKWEGNTFKFKITLNKDTLIQKGVEKVEEANIDRVIIEKYIRAKPNR